MSDWIKLLLSMSLSGSILAIVIFAIKPFTKHKISKSIQYYIWLVVLLRLIVPFSFEGSIMNNVFYGEQTIESAISENSSLPVKVQNEINPSIITTDQDSQVNTEYKETYNDENNYGRQFLSVFNEVALYIWILGTVISIIVTLKGYFWFNKVLRYANKPATDEENKILLEVSCGKSNIRLARNKFIKTPMALGIFRPCIIIPDDDFDENQIRNILLHEVSHLNRFDITIKWLTMIVTSIHWFNPLMYFIKKEINKACELACDENVIKGLNSQEKQAYGDTLIAVVAESKYPLSILQATMCEEKRSLKERLVAIMNYSKKSKVTKFFSVVLLLSFISASICLGVGVGSNKYSIKNLFVSTKVVEFKDVNKGEYDLEEISKYKTPYVGDFSKVFAIVNQLIIPDNAYTQRYISLETEKTPYGITIFYQTKEEKPDFSPSMLSNPNSDFNCNLRKNALILFSMIGNVDTITFSFCDSPYSGELDKSKYNCETIFSRQQVLKDYYNFDSIKEDIGLLKEALENTKKNYTLSKLES
ncbi:M56 family metallopeptidase [Clostridium cellulovorans]|uniref:Peptidase M56 BlaR1 n=1 Tax=Clostridium cellulovorans (strain ATCC 35296 / DSM 3052 / OCM 3 / 743B) TaxID=573061 RepID=D9SQG8_CLOC7|nr:M56 family metallopeptidase [Clostridium cellulovorans]ADL50235.1 peptidase M56 BlaR1 [Clostridium cellulovorans 743B]